MAEVLNSADLITAEPRRRISQSDENIIQSPPLIEKQEFSDSQKNSLLSQAPDNSENDGKHSVAVSGQGDTSHDVVQAAETYDSFQEMEECVEKPEAEVHAKCSKKCPVEIVEVIDDTALVANGDSNNDGIEGNKKEKKHKRRGGKGRKKREALLNCYYTFEKRQEKGLTYSREELVGHRFEELEEQQKKWVEVYCGLGLLVAKEYDGLVKCDDDKSRPEHVVNFDPRPKFQKALNLGEDCSQLSKSHIENSNTSDLASHHTTNGEIDSTVMEGECSEDDDSDEDYSSIQKPAFLVTGEPDFDSGPPQDGLEFLRRVRWEAAQIPKVKVGKVEKRKEQRPYMPQIPDIIDCPENLLPHKEWEDSFLADFSELRQGFSQLESQDSSTEEAINLQSAHHGDNLHQMLESIVVKNFDNTTSTENSCPPEASSMLETSGITANAHSPETSSIVSDYPTLSVILKMDPTARNSMLRKRISSVEKMSTLSRNDCLWLFALCATVDSPLDADACAALRSLLRKCASLRAAKTIVDDEVVMLNILATISGRYFGQSER